MSENAKPLKPSDILRLRHFFERYHADVTLTDYKVDADDNLISSIFTETQDERQSLHDTGDLIDTWASVTNGLCVICREQKAETMFFHTVDYRYGGVCRECSKYTF